MRMQEEYAQGWSYIVVSIYGDVSPDMEDQKL